MFAQKFVFAGALGMNEAKHDLVESTVYSLWKSRRYELAVDFIWETLASYEGEDVSVIELCYTLLKSSFTTLSHYGEAEAVLREGLARLPSSFFLRRSLAQFLWDIRKQPEQALTVIDQSIAGLAGSSGEGLSEQELNAQIELLSLRGRLLLAVGRIEDSLGTLRTILSLLPPFSPVVGHLFDYDLIVDLLRAGVRDVALREMVNRITEPQFLVNGVREIDFNQSKQHLNSTDYLPQAE
jgi:tetratricopeptide (TPR) repeat protein